MKIIMIYADKCPKCKSMRQTINSVVKHLELDVEVMVYNCKDNESIEVAIEYDISDVPGCNIGGTVIEGEDFDPDEVIKALEKLSK